MEEKLEHKDYILIGIKPPEKYLLEKGYKKTHCIFSKTKFMEWYEKEGGDTNYVPDYVEECDSQVVYARNDNDRIVIGKDGRDYMSDEKWEEEVNEADRL